MSKYLNMRKHSQVRKNIIFFIQSFLNFNKYGIGLHNLIVIKALIHIKNKTISETPVIGNSSMPFLFVI